MAATKITDLTELAVAPATGDLLVLVDVSDTSMAGSGTDKKITAANLLGGYATTASVAAGYQPLDATLTALAGFNANGLLVQTGADTFAGRTITGTTNQISVSNGDGTAGNPTLSIAAGYVGQTSITTLGTIATGTWNGTAIDAAHGGTGQTAYTDGQLLIGNTATGGLNKATLTAGTNVTITNGNGTITIAATAGAGGYATAQDEGSNLTQRSTINFIGPAVTAADDAANSRTNVTVSAVTSIDVSGGSTGLTTSGGPITSSGTVTLAGTLNEAHGGTNQTGYTLGDLLYASATNTLSRLAGNITATKKYLSQTGGGASSAAPAWSQVAFADLSGTASAGQIPDLSATYLTVTTAASTYAPLASPTFTGTVTANTLVAATRAAAINAAADGATVTFDLSLADTHSVTLGGNRTLALSNAPTASPWRRFTLLLKQDATGGRTVTWFAGITWLTGDGNPPTLSSGANETTVVSFVQTGNAAYLGLLVAVQTTTAGGSGTVTSVALTAPSWLAVAGSPITASGTLALSAATGQTANRVLATPDGTTGAVGLRALAAADYPTMVGDSGSGGTKGAVPAPAAGDAAAGKYLGADGTWSVPAGGGGGGTLTGSGTTGRVAKWSGATALGNATAGTDYLAPGSRPVAAKTTSYTVAAGDEILTFDATGGAITASLPAVASSAGMLVRLTKIDSSSNTVTIDPNASEVVVDPATGSTTTKALYLQWDSVTLACDGTRWAVVAKNLGKHRCRLDRTTAQSSIPAGGALTKILLSSATYNVGGIGDPTTNNRVNILRAGSYQITGLVSLASMAGSRRILCIIFKNGAEVLRSGTFVNGTGTATTTSASFSATLDLTAGDYVELYVFNEDTTLSTGTTVNSPYLIVQEL